MNVGLPPISPLRGLAGDLIDGSVPVGGGNAIEVVALAKPDRVEIAGVAGLIRAKGQAAARAAMTDGRDAHGRAWTQEVTDLANAAVAGSELARTARTHAGTLLHGAAGAEGEPGSIARRVEATTGTAAAFASGVAEGVAAGVRGFVASTLTLAGGAAQLAGDQSPLGDLGDFAREHGPAALRNFVQVHEEWIPSARHGAQTVASGMRALHGVGGYAARAAGDPVAFGHDVAATIGRVWDGVRADHARAAARGPEAEAHWFGALAGRAGFEAAATALPGVGLAERAGSAARVAGGLEEGAAVASRVARGTDAGTLLADAARADAAEPGRFAIDARHAAEAYRTRGDVDALVDGARRTGTLSQLLDANVLTDAETAKLLRAGKIAPTELPEVRIASSADSPRGKPAGIFAGFGDLLPRQKTLLDALPTERSRVLVRKTDVTLVDLAALTAKTGKEFAMFTRGPQRLVIRGSSGSVPVTETVARRLREDGWKWTAHTHPGTAPAYLTASSGDQAVLRAFGQEYSLIVNSRGQVSVFTKDDTLWKQPSSDTKRRLR